MATGAAATRKIIVEFGRKQEVCVCVWGGGGGGEEYDR